MKIVSGQRVKLKSREDIGELSVKGNWLRCGVKVTGQDQWFGKVVTVQNVYDGDTFDIVEDRIIDTEIDYVYTLNMVEETYPVKEDSIW